ncbi:BA14K family protein [Stappia sediminis]|nr:BA14K family protein [Stappia sediminis]
MLRGMTISKGLTAALAGAMMLPMASTADAGDPGTAIAAGAAGLAAGTLLGTMLSGPRYIDPPAPVYVAPPPPRRVYRDYYVEPAPVYRERVYVEYAPEPWTPEWYSYCSRKYRSFDPRSGYFVAYSGEYRFCR